MLVLDASMALAWHLKRQDSDESALAQSALREVARQGAVVPGLCYSEIGNGLLMSERRHLTDAAQIAAFQMDLAQLTISLDSASSSSTLSRVLSLARSWGLTAYDATYLELVLRTKWPLATFDRQLAEATRRSNAQSRRTRFWRSGVK
jgi:predicted nucleic acid-binding protein